MTDLANLLIGFAMGLNLLATVSSRLPSLIRTASFQGFILGALPLLLEHELQLALLAVSLLTMAIKGLLIPSLLRRAMRAAHIEREVEPLIGFIPSLWVGAAATIGALALHGSLPMQPEHADLLLVPAAIANIVCGLLLLVGRVKAITQVCGYLLLENGIFLFGLLLIDTVPLLFEAGVLLDLTVGIFVIGIIVDRIQREFDSLDTRKLTMLRE